MSRVGVEVLARHPSAPRNAKTWIYITGNEAAFITLVCIFGSERNDAPFILLLAFTVNNQSPRVASTRLLRDVSRLALCRNLREARSISSFPQLCPAHYSDPPPKAIIIPASHPIYTRYYTLYIFSSFLFQRIWAERKEDR